MGASGSRECRRTETAKLILQDGTIQEFSSPVKVWQILEKYPTSFVCNSDDMDFNDAVLAVDGNEDLRLGELYFVLPLTWLNHRLRAEEMAALAVKASTALAKSGGGGGLSYGDKDIPRKVSGGDWRVKRNSCGGGGCSGKGRRRKFTAELSLIAE